MHQHRISNQLSSDLPLEETAVAICPSDLLRTGLAGLALYVRHKLRTCLRDDRPRHFYQMEQE